MMMRLDVITDQCKRYEDIISKMEIKIKKLLTENKKLAKDLEISQQINENITKLESQIDTIFGEFQKL